MKRIIVAAAFISTLLIGSVAAEESNRGTGPSFQVVAPTIGMEKIGAPAPVAAPATQNTITTTAPVSSETTISVGTLASQFLAWLVAAFSVPIGSLAVWIMVRVLKNLGITATAAMRARLGEMVVNALNVSAPEIESRLAGQGQVAIKNEIVKSAIAYVQDHGADAIKTLGLDPQSGAAVEAIKARIETAIADPSIPTPKILDPTPTPTPAPAAVPLPVQPGVKP